MCWYTTRVVARVAHRAALLMIGTLFDADQHVENHFLIGAPGEARWIFAAQPSHRCQNSQIAIFERPPGLTRCSNQKMVFDLVISIKRNTDG